MVWKDGAGAKLCIFSWELDGLEMPRVAGVGLATRPDSYKVLGSGVIGGGFVDGRQGTFEGMGYVQFHQKLTLKLGLKLLTKCHQPTGK